MKDSNLSLKDLNESINDIKLNHHRLILLNLDELGKSLSLIKNIKLSDKDTLLLIKELFKQLKSELLFYFTHKEKEIFDDIILVSKKGIKSLPKTSGISSMINNSYDDFHTYIIDILKMLNKLDMNCFNENTFLNLDTLRKNIDILLEKDNSLLDKLFRIIIDYRQK